MTRRELLPLTALAVILVITAAWWALALWPLPDETPAWLERTRLVCFGSRRDTLPSAAGWLLLIGEPLAMLGLLAVGWPGALAGALTALRRSPAGRAGAVTATLLLLWGLTAATWRVRALAGQPFDPAAGEAPAQRVDQPAPLLGLVNQHGQRLEVAALRGRPAMMVFAFAHCTTVCPIVVREALAAGRAVAGSVLVIVTLDPLRDTPARLPALAAHWELGPDEHVLSGPVADVESVLDAWGIPRSRDGATGEITHPTFVYLVDRAGNVAWQVPGRAGAITPLLGAF